jgi:hypothetical protein
MRMLFRSTPSKTLLRLFGNPSDITPKHHLVVSYGCQKIAVGCALFVHHFDGEEEHLKPRIRRELQNSVFKLIEGHVNVRSATG